MSLPKQFALILLLISVLPVNVFSQAAAKDQDLLNLICELSTQRWEVDSGNGERTQTRQ